MFITFLHKISLFAIAIIFVACGDSYLYDEDKNKENSNVEVAAYMLTSLDSADVKFKEFLIVPGDSIIFTSKVFPFKAISNNRYFWTIDGNDFANEYTFKNTVNEPGAHTVAFVFVDYFGDTLSDTLHLTVATPPLLDCTNFIPAIGTQNINPYEFMNFAWNAYEPDSMWNVNYKFYIAEFGATKHLIDTVLTQAHFTYIAGFKPLKKYEWSVNACNELGQCAKNILNGNFFVKGAVGENAIMVKFRTTDLSNAALYKLNIFVFDENDSVIVATFTNSSENITIGPLPNGNYKIKANVLDYNDFSFNDLLFELKGDVVLDLGEQTLVDSLAPIIISELLQDTLNVLDTLKFLVRDGGGKIVANKISVQLDNLSIIDFKYENDTLKVPLKDKILWSYKIITVSALDLSGNKSSKNFYLKPNSTLAEVSSD